MTTHHIAFLIFPGCQGIDVSGPFEVFAGANRWLASQGRPAAYRLSLASPDGKAVATESGLSLNPTTSWARLRGPLQTLVVCGGFDVEAQAAIPARLQQIARLARKSERIASVCTGSFLLAAAGLLDGRRASTHWAFAKRMARLHPAIHVDADPIYTRDGRIWTSAGATAGIDLSLALVEADLGRDVALSIARWLVLFLRRPGTQRQFSAQLTAQLADHDPVRRVQAHIADRLDADLSLDRLAEAAHMSPRHFARCFRREVGMTPARYVLRLRLEAARRLLEDGHESLRAVARQCGLGSTETLRRLFLLELKVSPRDYRQRFQPFNNGLSQVPDSPTVESRP